MYHNNLIRNYNTIQSKQSNGMSKLSNGNQQFYQQMMMAKAEQMKKIKNVSELGLTRDQITEYIICPIKVERSSRNEIERYVSDEEAKLAKKYIEDNLWKNRTNAPYKNILKNEDWKKQFSTANDLIVHRVSHLDKIGLLDEYKKLVRLMEKHNNELKVIYSTTKESEHLKEFEYVNKYKYTVKYDPKDYNDLKEFYKNEQKKIEKEQKRIDHIINKLTDDDITADEIKLLENEFIGSNKGVVANQVDELDKQIMELLNDSVMDDSRIEDMGSVDSQSVDRGVIGVGEKIGEGDKIVVGDEIVMGEENESKLPKVSRIKIQRSTRAIISKNADTKIEKTNGGRIEKPKRGAMIIRKSENKKTTDMEGKQINTNDTEHKKDRIRRIGIVRRTN